MEVPALTHTVKDLGYFVFVKLIDVMSARVIKHLRLEEFLFGVRNVANLEREEGRVKAQLSLALKQRLKPIPDVLF